MPTCPSCGERVRPRQVISGDLRHVSCDHCTAIMSVKTRAGLLPALMLIFLGAPTAKAVQEGWFSIPAGIIGGLCVMVAAGWFGYVFSSTSLIRHRHEVA
jgi:hypothetical protein